MKKAILVCTAIMTAGMLALAGCGKKETGQAGEYTNLADKESRKAVVGELEACGVTKEQTAALENGRGLSRDNSQVVLISQRIYSPSERRDGLHFYFDG